MKKVIVAICLLGSHVFAPAQSGGVVPDNYIVVIGAFAIPENALRFTMNAKGYGLEAKSEFNKNRNLHYVYVMQSSNKGSAVAEARRIREATPLKDTWVYVGRLTEIPGRIAEPVAEVPPVKPEPIPIELPVEIPTEQPVNKPESVAPPLPEQTREEKIKEAVESKPMAMKKGEVQRLDFIYFYRDAAVLRPESRFEVDRLVQVMKSNPDEKIIIHGHTNGNAKGPIIRLPEGSNTFFSLENTIEDFGSAAKLSELRAQLIRDYLVANGIDTGRMTIKAWGGKKPLYAVHDEKAEANVRVEIEVVN